MADGIAISGGCFNHSELLLTLGKCYCLTFGWCYCQYCHDTDRCYCHHWGWCYCLILYLWQMLLPSVLADVIANYVEDVTPHVIWTICNKCVGWCLLPVADGIATAGWPMIVADVIA